MFFKLNRKMCKRQHTRQSDRSITAKLQTGANFLLHEDAITAKNAYFFLKFLFLETTVRKTLKHLPRLIYDVPMRFVINVTFCSNCRIF